LPDNKIAEVSPANREQGSLELTEELIQMRAYQYYEERGGEHGHDVDDWLRAEAEIFGKKNIAAAAEPEMAEQDSKAEAA
jgi:DUF2934 family protein